ATSGTAQALEAAGISAVAVGKIGHGRPNVIDVIDDGRVTLVVNTVSHFETDEMEHPQRSGDVAAAGRTVKDGYRIRLAAELRCGNTFTPLLRRPFSVAWTANDMCGFVFEEVGAGTRLLAALRPGDTLDVLGPLGAGFHLDAGRGPVVCVSGGVGCAPFPMLI